MTDLLDKNKYKSLISAVEETVNQGQNLYRQSESAQFSVQTEEQSVSIDESASLIKDYEKMSADGKKDANIIDTLMSMPKYKNMSRDQISKAIGDHKRKGIFKR